MRQPGQSKATTPRRPVKVGKPVCYFRRANYKNLVNSGGQHSLNKIRTLRRARKVSREKRMTRCQTCTSYWPRRGRDYECLSGMTTVSPTCEEYEFAIFQLVSEWDYTLKQINWMRKAEASMKKAQGMEVDR